MDLDQYEQPETRQPEIETPTRGFCLSAPTSASDRTLTFAPKQVDRCWTTVMGWRDDIGRSKYSDAEQPVVVPRGVAASNHSFERGMNIPLICPCRHTPVPWHSSSNRHDIRMRTTGSRLRPTSCRLAMAVPLLKGIAYRRGSRLNRNVGRTRKSIP